MKAARIQRLRRFFDGLAAEYRQQPPPEDLLLRARGFAHPRDRELAAFIASVCSFGSASAGRALLDRLFDRLGRQPGRTLVKANREQLAELTQDLRLQFLGPEAFFLLLHALRNALKRYRSLEALYLHARGPENRRRPLDAIDRFMSEIGRPISPEERASSGVGHLLPRPAKGSATQRLHLFLRAVARPDDGLDLGLWSSPRPNELLLPVDGPLLEYARLLKLTERERAVRGAAIDLTRTLHLLDAGDPIRFHPAFLQMRRLGLDSDALRERFRHA